MFLRISFNKMTLLFKVIMAQISQTVDLFLWNKHGDFLSYTALKHTVCLIELNSHFNFGIFLDLGPLTQFTYKKENRITGKNMSTST